MLNIVLKQNFLNKKLELDLQKLLKQKGFTKTKLSGYTYLCNLIIDSVKNSEIPYVNITKKLKIMCNKHSYKYLTSIDGNIENCIKHSSLSNLSNAEAIAELYWDFLEKIYYKYCPDNKEFRIYKRVSSILNKNGFVNRNLEGYYYILYILCDSLMNNTIAHRNITKVVYPKMSKLFNKPTSSIESCIRNSINRSYLKDEMTKQAIAKLYEQAFVPSNGKLHESICSVFKQNGFFNSDLDGYYYLYSLLAKSLEKDFIPYKDLTTVTYLQIAKQYDCTWQNIERSIRNVIKVSYLKEYKNSIAIAILYKQISEKYYDYDNEEGYIKKVVELVLKNNGFKQIHLDGYIYLSHILSDSIITNTKPYKKMTVKIFPNTAKLFNVSNHCVETCIREIVKKSLLKNLTLTEAIHKLHFEISDIVNLEKT